MDIADEYRGKIEAGIRQVISQPKYRASGEGLSSLTVTVIEGNAKKSPVIVVTIADQIVRLESRNLQWTELPNMKNLLSWASYKKSDPKEAKQLAWAVAKDKQKNDTWKPKLWRRQSLSAALKEMNKAMVAAFDKAIEEDILKAGMEGLQQ
jgi:hypothetical protein